MVQGKNIFCCIWHLLIIVRKCRTIFGVVGRKRILVAKWSNVGFFALIARRFDVLKEVFQICSSYFWHCEIMWCICQITNLDCCSCWCNCWDCLKEIFLLIWIYLSLKLILFRFWCDRILTGNNSGHSIQIFWIYLHFWQNDCILYCTMPPNQKRR